ncbi:NAD(P)/FAD-dependent oxidoreductase [Arthrobacter psychrolactophilus]
MQDVIIIGGGAAGLNAALVLGRSRRSVTVIDAGQPRNAPAHAAHGFLTRDGVAPLELTRLGRADLAPYDAHVEEGTVVRVEQIDGGFQVTLDSGAVRTSRRLLITTGLVDELPDIPGLAQHWGKNLAHCPYCHGWEIKDQAIGVIGSSDFAVHQTLLFRQSVPHHHAVPQHGSSALTHRTCPTRRPQYQAHRRARRQDSQRRGCSEQRGTRGWQHSSSPGADHSAAIRCPGWLLGRTGARVDNNALRRLS